MIRVQTGNQLDVVVEYRDGKKVITGLQPWDGNFIPLTNPMDFAEVLVMELRSALDGANEAGNH